MFIDKDTILPGSHEIPTGNGKIGTIEGGKISSSSSTGCQGAGFSFFTFSDGKIRPQTDLDRARRLWETESVMMNECFHDLSGLCDEQFTARMFSRLWREFLCCLRSTNFSSRHF